MKNFPTKPRKPVVLDISFLLVAKGSFLKMYIIGEKTILRGNKRTCKTLFIFYLNYEVIGSVITDPVVEDLFFEDSLFPDLVALRKPSTEPLPTILP